MKKKNKENMFEENDSVVDIKTFDIDMSYVDKAVEEDKTADLFGENMAKEVEKTLAQLILEAIDTLNVGDNWSRYTLLTTTKKWKEEVKVKLIDIVKSFEDKNAKN